MKKLFALAGISALLLSGCGSTATNDSTTAPTPKATTTSPAEPTEEVPTPEETPVETPVPDVVPPEDLPVVDEAVFLEELNLPHYELNMNDADKVALGNNVCAKLDKDTEIGALIDWVILELSADQNEGQVAEEGILEGRATSITGTSINAFCSSYRDDFMTHMEDEMLEQLREEAL